jgi:hypothetical protein
MEVNFGGVHHANPHFGADINGRHALTACFDEDKDTDYADAVM